MPCKSIYCTSFIVILASLLQLTFRISHRVFALLIDLLALNSVV